MTMKKILVAAVVAAITLTSVNADDIKGRGASFPGPVYKVWTSEYYKVTGVQVNYAPTGSGDGIKSIGKRMVDFVGSDKLSQSKKTGQR